MLIEFNKNHLALIHIAITCHLDDILKHKPEDVPQSEDEEYFMYLVHLDNWQDNKKTSEEILKEIEDHWDD
jgi:hypothetical protein